MTAPRVTLPILDAKVESRARSTREAHPWWPCREGCDRCCRSLPHLPTITRAEWDRLAEALARLPADVRELVEVRTREAPSVRPVICPMLDRDRGSCLVYDARPIACRTYGFYAERDGGLHCEDVGEAVAANAAEQAVVWGNGEAIADELRAFGPARPLGTWMQSADATGRLLLSPSARDGIE